MFGTLIGLLRSFRTNSALLLLAVLSASLVACGGGSSDAGTIQTPTPSPTTTAQSIALIPTSGGDVSIGTQVIATIAPTTLAAAANVSVSLAPKSDSIALANNDTIVTLPTDQLTIAPGAQVTVFIYPDGQATAAAAGRVHVLGLSAGLDSPTVYAKVQIADTTPAIAYPTSALWDAAKGAYSVTLSAEQLAAGVVARSSQAVGSAATNTVKIIVNLITTDRTASAARSIYYWPRSGIETAPAATANVTGRVPLILVHGLDLGIDACGDNELYKSTWVKFVENFYNDNDLPSRYDLYTFRYPTNEGIQGNGQDLLAEIYRVFGSRQVVIVSHSMGGLVTRVADSLSGLTGNPVINIARAITLDTPHLGAGTLEDIGAVARQATCVGSGGTHQGADDLKWEFNSDGSCANQFLCDLNSGTNLNLLKKYVAYSGTFDIPYAADTELTPFVLIYNSLPLPFKSKHSLYIAPRVAQMYYENGLPIAARSGGDGAVFVDSQLLEDFVSPYASAWIDIANRFLKVHSVFADTDHSSIHDDPKIFSGWIRADLLDFYNQIVSPTSDPSAIRASFNPGACIYDPLSPSGEAKYHDCQASVVEDFTQTIGNCTVSKQGGTLTLTTSGNTTSPISVNLNGDYNDEVDQGSGGLADFFILTGWDQSLTKVYGSNTVSISYNGKVVSSIIGYNFDSNPPSYVSCP